MTRRKGHALAHSLVCLLFGAAMLLPAGQVRADAGWFESGDVVLRIDLMLLNDAGVIRLPITEWPLPRAAVRHAIDEAKTFQALNTAVTLALERVRARLDHGGARGAGRLALAGTVGGGSPALLRNFATPVREDGELGVRAAYENARFAVSLNATAVASPEDGQELRADGSHATLQWGNWLFSANTLDRFWGPSHESSLILSNNARPMPTVMVERATARPFESRWLDWLGPWRFSFGISRMEGSREDIDRPLFMAWRVAVMPFKDIELGFSRTAQFCGEQLSCDLDTFGNMLAGNDNVGIDATAENEPGNQMAGFDIRWASPLGSWPYAIYSQMIGEDESSYLPAKYLAQYGLEAWRPSRDGGMLQMFAEYSTTTCSANTDRGPYYNCAYNQGQFNVEGYRYRGRVIGYTADRDSDNYALGATYTMPDGSLWGATARTSRLNRDDSGDVRNTVSSVPASYDALELSWQGRLFGDRVTVNVGVESLEPAGAEREVEPFGLVSWKHEFGP
jgi:hypothetical protein